MKGLEAFLRIKAHDLVTDAVAAQEVDFVGAVAAPLPLAAIAEILGVPDEERELFYTLGDKIDFVDNPPGADAAIDMDAAVRILDEADKLRRKVEAGVFGNHLLTALAHAVYDPDKGESPSAEKVITPLQFDLFFIQLFMAGNETTRNSLASGIAALATHPDQWQMLKDDRSDGLLKTAANEIFRWATPVRYLRRTALEPILLGGAEVKRGDKVVVSLTGANRDRKVFNDPYTFNIKRDEKGSLAFGYASHFCLGRHLAQLETEVVLSELVDQVDTIKLCGRPERDPSTLINNIGRLPLKLEVALQKHDVTTIQ
jgi:cholest-4-en-3-one 26-monooxygenase